MNIVVVDLTYGMAVQNEKINYGISELAAIRLDEEMHTASVFRFIEEHKSAYARGEMAFAQHDQILVTDMVSGWTAFREWLQKDEMLVIRKQECISVMKYADSLLPGKANRKLPCKTIDLMKLYCNMTEHTKKKEYSLRYAMEELALVCDAKEYERTMYRAQCMVRLFRKLYKAGREEMGARFVHGLQDEDYFYISLHTFFPKLEKKKLLQRNKEVTALLRNKGFDHVIHGDVVKIHTAHADWAINLEKHTGALQYFTHDFYRGIREVTVSLRREMSRTEKIGAICDKIEEIEQELQYGVGNEEISSLLHTLCC